MDKTIKIHIDAIAEHLKGTKNSFLFLVSDGDSQHIAKNCEDHNTAALMVNYIDSTPGVDTAFSNYVLNQAHENGSPLLDLLDEKMEEKEIIIQGDHE